MGADIGVIPEIAKPELPSEHCLWFGTNPNQGIAITSSPSYILTPLSEKASAPKYVIPIRVDGPVCFTLFAVWAIKGQGNAKESKQVLKGYFSGRNVPITLPLTTVKKRFFSTTLISGNSTSSILVSRAGSSASGIVESSKIIKVAAAVPSKR